MRPNEVAAALMEHLCAHDWHGYSQVSRWGDGEGTCPVEVGGETYYLEQGDRDCSSAVISCYEAAGVGCGGATYTGNMRACMTATGSFEWMPMSYTAQRGDIYLNEASHTAMCVSASPDMLAEFNVSENGTIDGAEGDQTGVESRVAPYYDFPWDGILRYVGGGGGGAQGGPPEPRYRALTREDGWLPWMEGLSDTGGSGDDFAGVPGHKVYDMAFERLGPGGWFQLTLEGGEVLPRNAGNEPREKAVIGVTVYYSTPEPGKTGWKVARYRAHWTGASPAWGKWERDDADGGAGNDRDPIDMVQLHLADA